MKVSSSASRIFDEARAGAFLRTIDSKVGGGGGGETAGGPIRSQRIACTRGIHPRGPSHYPHLPNRQNVHQPTSDKSKHRMFIEKSLVNPLNPPPIHAHRATVQMGRHPAGW